MATDSNMETDGDALPLLPASPKRRRIFDADVAGDAKKARGHGGGLSGDAGMNNGNRPTSQADSQPSSELDRLHADAAHIVASERSLEHDDLGQASDPYRTSSGPPSEKSGLGGATPHESWSKPTDFAPSRGFAAS